MSGESGEKQLLHLVFGGELKKLGSPEFRDLDALDIVGTEFRDLSKVDLVGVYPNYAEALDAWRGAAQRTVDDAEMKYVIVHLHRLLEPDVKGSGST